MLIPKFIRYVLLRFNHQKPKSPQHSPHENTSIIYHKKTRQYALQPDTSELLDKKGVKYVQQATGLLLYYARTLDGTMLPALKTIGTE